MAIDFCDALIPKELFLPSVVAEFYVPAIRHVIASQKNQSAVHSQLCPFTQDQPGNGFRAKIANMLNSECVQTSGD